MDEPTSSVLTCDNIEDTVPSEWKYKILKKLVFGNPPKLEVCLKVSLFSVDEIEKWIESLEEKTQCSYSIQMTKKTMGEKVLFKRRYHCRLKTKFDKAQCESNARTRNTRCPSRLSVTLMNVKKKKFRGKYPPDPEMPCLIDYVITHNHSLRLAARYRKVPKNTQDTLNLLFNSGHSASTAYEILRIDTQMHNPNDYEELLVNRSVCPDRNYCHKLYNNFKKDHGNVDFNRKSLVYERIEQYNKEVGEECAQYEITTDGYVIVLCPPLFKRIHQHMKSASEIVFMAAINKADNDGSKAFFMMTNSDCGALPLGIIITSSEDDELITIGLNNLKALIGDSIFFGSIEGPQMFILDDCEAGQIALNSVWPNSDVLFCSLHILHTLWRYLMCSKNGLNGQEPIAFFKQFRMILYAESIEECNQYYNEAIQAAANHPNYTQILEAYWDKRDMWAQSYKQSSSPTDITKIHNLEKSMCLLREPIFHRMRGFNVVQLVDFLLTKFVEFYKLRLLDAANCRLVRDLTKKNPLPPVIKALEQVNNHIYLVPSIKLPHVRYYVNVEIVTCTCLKNATGYICNHIGWLLTLNASNQCRIEDVDVRNVFHEAATGEKLVFLDEDVSDEEGANEMESNDEKSLVDDLIVAGNEVIKLEIIEEKSNLPRVGVFVPVVSDEQALEIGEKINEDLFKTFGYFLNKSPLTVGPVLQQMLNSFQQLSSVEEFLTTCKQFTEVLESNCANS
ncbi:unnamed protein product [Phyllotreta striolata]|uniref:SWIM-type domain-containing protein n=1 Tax=Phyllotreta striolata TaxID=444603 RepID=A0A9N9XV72_PHYSR|nr:unnamed protein product [Phyllotreta striolata]